jgi:hypothetical protein
MKLILLLIIAFIYMVFAPILVIWSLNNLFKLAIDYSYINWLSVFALLTIMDTIFNGSNRASKL